MNAEAISKAAERLHQEVLNSAVPSMNNYQDLIAEFKRIISDQCVLIRELAKLADEQKET